MAAISRLVAMGRLINPSEMFTQSPIYDRPPEGGRYRAGAGLASAVIGILLVLKIFAMYV
jgi:hypothetical protein